MKNLVLSMLAIASITAMNSCSSESDPIDEAINAGNQEKVEIKLNAGVVGIETKAPITSSSTFTPSIVGWNVATQPSTTTAPKWTTTPTAAISGSASAAKIELTDKQYYEGDATLHSFIRGYHPAGTSADGSVTFTNTTGEEDVMMTEIVDAGTRTNNTTAALVFSHKLSQLNFKVAKDATLPAGVTLTSIAIKNAELPTGFDIVTGEIAYAAAADLTVPGISSQEINTEASAGNAVMIKPLSSTEIKLDIVTSQGEFKDVPVTVEAADSNGGTSYTITLTFKQKEVATTASVTDWTQKTGSGEVM